MGKKIFLVCYFNPLASLSRVKREVRILGIDDASFDKFSDRRALVIGTVFRGGQWLDGVMTCTVEVDGDDATDMLAAMVGRSRFRSQLQCIMLDGIALGGFNIVDIEALSQRTGLPVIAVMRDYPQLEKIHAALRKLGKGDNIALLERAGTIHAREGIHFQVKGASEEEAREFLSLSTTRANIPEPLRVAHLIGAGIGKGESTGRA